MTTGLFSFTPWQCVVFSNVSHKKAKKEKKKQKPLTDKIWKKSAKSVTDFFQWNTNGKTSSTSHDKTQNGQYPHNVVTRYRINKSYR